MKLDVYKPSELDPWPVVIALNGGGQNKELFNVFSKHIAELGTVVFTPIWLSGEPQGEQITRDQITGGWEDAACALRFAHAKAADYEGDPSRVVAEIKFHLIVGGDEELVEMVEIINKKLMAAEYETTRTQFPGVDHGAMVSLPLPELSGVIEDAQHP